MTLVRSTMWTVGIGVLVAGCGGPLSGRYAGEILVTQGACTGEARVGDRMPATLVLRDGEALFVPGDGVIELRGRVDASGQVAVSASRPGSAANKFVQVFEGAVKDGRATGQYATPRCRADVALVKRS